jgi:hypothetical protein
MSNQPVDNSYAASINRGTNAVQLNHPQPTQKPGQTWESHVNETNAYNHANSQTK